MENQKESLSSSSVEDQLWMLLLNLPELNISEDKSRLKKPEVKPLQRVTQCQEEEAISVDNPEAQDQLKPTLLFKPQLFSSVVFHSTQLKTQSESSSVELVRFNPQESLLTDKLKR